MINRVYELDVTADTFLVYELKRLSAGPTYTFCHKLNHILRTERLRIIKFQKVFFDAKTLLVEGTFNYQMFDASFILLLSQYVFAQALDYELVFAVLYV